MNSLTNIHHRSRGSHSSDQNRQRKIFEFLFISLFPAPWSHRGVRSCQPLSQLDGNFPPVPVLLLVTKCLCLPRHRPTKTIVDTKIVQLGTSLNNDNIEFEDDNFRSIDNTSWSPDQRSTQSRSTCTRSQSAITDHRTRNRVRRSTFNSSLFAFGRQIDLLRIFEILLSEFSSA